MSKSFFYDGYVAALHSKKKKKLETELESISHTTGYAADWCRYGGGDNSLREWLTFTFEVDVPQMGAEASLPKKI